MGPNSGLWKGFADPLTHIVTYSIELARVSLLGGGLQATTVVSNITFGSANDATYTGKTNLTLMAEYTNNSYMYAVSSIAMGVVY